MVDITVVRGVGTRPGPDIFDPLLTTDAAALARGRQELFAASAHDLVRLNTMFQPELLPGDLVRVLDAWQGITYAAVVTQVEHVGEGNEVSTHLELWKRRDE